MWIGVVVGTVVSTRKDERLVGFKLLVVQPLDLTGLGHSDSPKVVVDRIGAGIGERVLVVTGSSARTAAGSLEAPVDGAVVGIVDTVDLEESLLLHDPGEG